MRCESIDFGDDQWEVRGVEPIGKWQGRTVRVVSDHYQPDENAVGGNSPSDSDFSGGYEVGAYARQDRDGDNSVGFKGQVRYGNDSVSWHAGSRVEINSNGKVSGGVEIGVKGDF